jgi:hypothetical protein
MAANLVSLVSQILTPDVIAKIASALGLDFSVAQKAIGGAIPAILAAMTGIASKPDGARQLSNAVAQQAPGILDNVMSAIGGSGQRAFAESGSNALSKLLGGGGPTTALAAAIGKFAGTSTPTAGSLVGMLAPIVLGALGHQQRSAGLDANGLASLLSSQKDQIAAAIPSGLANQLGGTGLLDVLGKGAAGLGRVGGAAERTVASASEAAQAMGHAASSQAARAAAKQWPLWLVGLAILAGLAWYLIARDTGEKVAEQTPPRTAQSEPAGGTVGLATPSLAVGGVNLASQVNASVGALRTALSDISDVRSAESALPKIRDAKAQLDRVSALAEQLPPDGRRALARLVATAMPAINGLCDKVLAMPGVAGVARPTIDELRARLDALATA